MADATKKTHFMRVTSRGVTRFFESVGASEICPVCGNSNWAVIIPPDREVYSVLSLPDESHILNSGANIPVIAAACSRCYFIRFHAAVPLTEWLQNNPSDEDGAGAAK